MRIFQTQSMWDAKEGRWYEVFSVDGESCSGEEYFRELETEQCLEDDEIDKVELEESSYCMCCECKDNEDCPDFECTCCKNEGLEEDYIDNDLVIQCDCPDCVEQRRLDQCNCKDCDCKDGSACDGCGREIEEQDDECDCLECREEAFISMAHDFIMGSNGCPDCILECLIDFADDMKNIGWESHKGYIAECNEDS